MKSEGRLDLAFTVQCPHQAFSSVVDVKEIRALECANGDIEPVFLVCSPLSPLSCLSAWHVLQRRRGQW